MSAERTIDDVVRRLGQDANLSLSAHILLRHGNDLVLVIPSEQRVTMRTETCRLVQVPEVGRKGIVRHNSNGFGRMVSKLE